MTHQGHTGTMAEFSVAINTYSYSYSHSAMDCMLHLKKLGYRSFELLATPPHFWPADLDARARREIPRRLADEGIRIISFNYPSLDHNLVSPMPDMRRFTIDRFRALIELAGQWSVPWIIVVPGKMSPLFPASRNGGMIRWAVESLTSRRLPRACGPSATTARRCSKLSPKGRTRTSWKATGGWPRGVGKNQRREQAPSYSAVFRPSPVEP